MASSLLSFTSLVALLLTTFSTSSIAGEHRRPPSLSVGLRLSLKHVYSGHNLTKLELLQRSVIRSRLRLQRLSSLASAATPPPPSIELRPAVHPGEGEFLVELSIGTPALPFSAVVDTGSDLIWTQCAPCVKCFAQTTPIFDPKNSTTFSNVSCSSNLCQDVSVFKCDNGCKYLYAYGDESSTQGYLAMDTFTFNGAANGPISVPNIGFGCGMYNQGVGFSQGSGLMGLGRGPLSLVSQLHFGKFSYCLTSMDDRNKSSTLLFGPLADLNYTGIQGTPLIQSSAQPTFYYVSLEGITVGETMLPVSKSVFELRDDGSGGTIIDSGTTISYIPEEAFEALKKEFRSQMKLRVSRTDATGLDLCFDLPSGEVTEIEVPNLKLHFRGLELQLPGENYMLADPDVGVVCLAMAATRSMSIIGNMQQQNMLVLHDLEKEMVSFLPTQCNQL